MAAVSRATPVSQDTHKVISLLLNSEIGVGRNLMSDLDAEDLFTLNDWLEPQVVDKEDLHKKMSQHLPT